jgi:hypothetical protein
MFNKLPAPVSLYTLSWKSGDEIVVAYDLTLPRRVNFRTAAIIIHVVK